MARLLTFFLLVSSVLITKAQTVFSSEKITTGRIPKTIKFRGKLVDAWKWKDKLGDNVLITSIVRPYKVKGRDEEAGEEVYSAELHAFHFVKGNTEYKLLWKISDMEKECPFDLSVGFIIGATKIMDLDNDGIAETSIQYKLACRSDVSPSQMKLIMHEDTVKYALRGTMWIPNSEHSKFTVSLQNVNLESWQEYKGADDEYEKLFGRYESEKDFLTAPAGFLNFARNQWLRHVKESFD